MTRPAACSRRRARLASFPVLALVALGSVPRVGAETTAPAAVATPSPPAAIPAADVPLRIEAAHEHLRAIATALETELDVEDARTTLERLRADVAELVSQTRTKLPEIVTVRDTEVLHRSWTTIRDQLTERSQGLAARVARLDVIASDLRLADQVWALTMKETLGDDAAALTSRIKSLRRDIDAQTLAVRSLRSAMLTIQGALVELGTSTTENLAQVVAKRADLRHSMFSADAQPLWAIERDDVIEVLGDLRAVLRQHLGELRLYVREHPWRVGAHLIFFLMVAAAALRTRAHVAAQTADAGAFYSDRLRQRPFAAAALVALLVWGWFHPAAPQSMRAVRRMLLVLPGPRLLQVGLFAQLPVALWGTVALLIVDVPRELFSPLSAIGRFCLLAESLAAIAAALWLRQPAILGRLPLDARRRRLVSLACGLATALLGVAAVANVAGNVALADLLTDGTLNSGFAAVMLFEAYHVLTGLLLLALAAPPLQAIQSVRNHASLVRQRTTRLLRTLLLLAWGAAALYLFTLIEPATDLARHILGARLAVGSLALSAGDILAFFVTVWVASWLARFVSFVLDEDVLPRLSLPRGVPGAVSTSTRYAILLFGAMAALSAAGVDFGRLTVLLGAFGVGLSFGLQNVVNNFVSGLILLVERPIRTGDSVEIDNVSGEVRSIGIRSSIVRTSDGAEVVVPNGTLLSQKVTNWTLSDQHRRIDVNVGVAYGNDPRRVIEILTAAATSNPDIIAVPEPVALFLGFGDSSLNFSLRAWTVRQSVFGQVRSDLHIAVYSMLNTAGIEIPFPQRDVNLRATAPAEPK